jgi:hypothetical protein
MAKRAETSPSASRIPSIATALVWRFVLDVPAYGALVSFSGLSEWRLSTLAV